MSYSTGEIAKICNVSVRTVQFYDGEGLLKPDSISEGGRRVYGEEQLKTLQMILMYKGLGLSLFEIRGVLSSEDGGRKILLTVLDEKQKVLDDEIKQKLSARDSIKVIRQYLSEGRAMPENYFFDVRTIMKGKRKLKATYAALLVVGAVVDALEIAFIVLWAVKGIWLPFAVGMPCVVALVAAAVALAYKNLAYVCCNCGEKFRPKFGQFMFSAHTPKTRRLTCPHCGERNFHTETYSD